MKLLIIDGQGGRIGSRLIEELRSSGYTGEILAVGANAIATAAMLKAGADRGATGENPVTVSARRADIIAGPIGIVLADSMDGEITPKMAQAVAASDALRVLIPLNKCGTKIAATDTVPLSELIASAKSIILEATDK